MLLETLNENPSGRFKLGCTGTTRVEWAVFPLSLNLNSQQGESKVETVLTSAVSNSFSLAPVVAPVHPSLNLPEGFSDYQLRWCIE